MSIFNDYILSVPLLNRTKQLKVVKTDINLVSVNRKFKRRKILRQTLSTFRFLPELASR